MHATAAGALPPPLDSLTEQQTTELQRHLVPLHFSAGERIFSIGDPGDACFIIDDGRIRVDLDSPEFIGHLEVDSDRTLDVLEAGSILGEMSLLDALPRSASAIAEADTTVRRLDLRSIVELAASRPEIAAAIFAALGRDASLKLRRASERLAHAIFDDPPDPLVGEMVRRAVAAQSEIATWDETRIDSLLLGIATAIAQHGEELALAAVEETGLGNVRDKRMKDLACSLGAYSQMAGRVGSGVLHIHPETGVQEIAAPAGVVFGIGPVTNPVSTFVFKVLACLKSRNALIFSPNRKALGVTERVQGLIDAVLDEHGAPASVVQSVRNRTGRKATAQFMSHPAVALILATGGPSMVQAAYSSGTPAIGVGAGNTPVLISSTADVGAVVDGLLLSKTFDNGLLCGAEHNLVVVRDARDAFIEACLERGVTILTDEERNRFSARIRNPETNRLDSRIVGQSAAAIARVAGIDRDAPIALIVVPVDGPVTEDNPYLHEKLAPVLSMMIVDDDESGVVACLAIINIEGRGHTAVVHTEDAALVDRFGAAMPASRILVNTPSTQGMLGLTTGLSISTTLGCGTFGGTSTTDNVTYANLRNIKRLAPFVPEIAAASAALVPVDG
jgi:acetaldehyde dehydrogenase/alcohol dehydrogenase